MRILVTGAREWTTELGIRMALVAIGPAVVVHGGAPGVDTLAAAVARSVGWPVEAHPADTARLGPRAVALRNQAMVDLGANVCVAFPLLRSRDAWDCVRRARTAGIPVLIPATPWQLTNGRDTVAVAVLAGAVVEAAPSLRWTIGRPWAELGPRLRAEGWYGRPIGR